MRCRRRGLRTTLMWLVAGALSFGTVAGGPSGCQACRAQRRPADAETPPAPAWQEIQSAQRVRLERLLPLRAGGPVELTWRDERGRRFETCRGELSLRSTTDAALDLRKVGERFLWVGSDAEQQWVFDLRRGEEAVWIRRRGEAWPGGGPPLPAEVDLAELFGLMTFEEQPLREPEIDLETWDVRVVLGPSSAPRTLMLDRQTLHPTRLELHDAAGRLLLNATLENYEPVEREGLPPGARPRFPTRVRLTGINPDGGAEGTVTLFLVPPETPPRIAERIFSLPALVETFRPTVVHSASQ